jgi:hypothetical protein
MVVHLHGKAAIGITLERVVVMIVCPIRRIGHAQAIGHPRDLTAGRALIEGERLYRLRGAYITSGYGWTRPRRSLRPAPLRQRYPSVQCRAGEYGLVLQLRLRPNGRSWALKRGRMLDALTRVLGS